jgi:hypothetical protein
MLYEKSFNLKTISQDDFGHFRENNLIILSKVAKITLKIVFKLKIFPHEIRHSASPVLTRQPPHLGARTWCAPVD